MAWMMEPEFMMTGNLALALGHCTGNSCRQIKKVPIKLERSTASLPFLWWDYGAFKVNLEGSRGRSFQVSRFLP